MMESSMRTKRTVSGHFTSSTETNSAVASRMTQCKASGHSSWQLRREILMEYGHKMS